MHGCNLQILKTTSIYYTTIFIFFCVLTSKFLRKEILLQILNLLAKLVIYANAGVVPSPPLPHRALCTNELVRCDDPGAVRTLCHEECLGRGECWQQTVINKCSCQGFQSHLKEMAVFGPDGEARGEHFIKNIHQYSRSVATNLQKVTTLLRTVYKEKGFLHLSPGRPRDTATSIAAKGAQSPAPGRPSPGRRGHTGRTPVGGGGDKHAEFGGRANRAKKRVPTNIVEVFTR